MSAALCLLAIVLVLTQTHSTQAAGYHYDRPTAQPILPIVHHHHGVSGAGGHFFSPLPTISPLPPVPSLPPLPTARPGSHIQTHVVQSHPAPFSQPASKSIAASYLPPSGQYGAPAYRPVAPSALAAPPQPPAPFQYGQRLPATGSGVGNYPTPSYPTTATAQAAPQGPTAPSAGFPALPIITTQAAPQPLRIPFGKQAVIHYPTPSAEPTYGSLDGRQLKQYAVIEIIDNDIEQPSKPFLTAPVYDSIRAQIGASGTGAVPPAPSTSAFQIDLRSGAFAAEQQRIAQQQRSDPVALGSGGLGFIRLSNGNVYLGSGSLGFISNQQHAQSVFEARNRKEQVSPNALHFGHGSLEDFRSGRF